MTTRITLLALTALLAGASAPAVADGFSINIGTPGEFLHFDNYRYHHDRSYHDRYDRWHAEHDRRGHDDRGRHDDGGRHDDHGHDDHGHDH